MSRKILFIHAGGAKPDADTYAELSHTALSNGIQRDHPELADRFRDCDFELLYYADLFDELYAASYDSALDLADRRLALRELTALDKSKRFRRVNYERLPQKSALPEFFAGVGAPLSRMIGLGKRFAGRVIPEYGLYQQDADIAAALNERVEAALRRLLANDGAALLISHGFGSVPTYNALWRLSHGEEPLPDKFDTWITLGAPLADNAVRGALDGAGEAIERRHPTNLVSWYNVAAEDDPVCHDETVADDFKPLLKRQQIARIVDHKIYNLALRFGRSYPRASVGYLIHPRVSALVADWLNA
ncbi:MAG: hypothetical protein AAF515_07370 [Pseudomonadota bacterium]